MILFLVVCVVCISLIYLYRYRKNLVEARKELVRLEDQAKFLYSLIPIKDYKKIQRACDKYNIYYDNLSIVFIETSNNDINKIKLKDLNDEIVNIQKILDSDYLKSLSNQYFRLKTEIIREIIKESVKKAKINKRKIIILKNAFAKPTEQEKKDFFEQLTSTVTIIKPIKIKGYLSVSWIAFEPTTKMNLGTIREMAFSDSLEWERSYKGYIE